MRSFSDMWYDPVARKKILIFGGAGLAFIIILIIIIVVATSGSKPASFNGSMVLSEVPLIDGHNGLANNLLVLEKNQLNDFDFKNLTGNAHWNNATNKYGSNTDLIRLDGGKVRGQFWSAHVECGSTSAVLQTLEQIDVIKRLIDKYPEAMTLATDHDGIHNAFYQNKVGSLIAIDGGHSIGSSLAVLRLYYELGVRSMSLTHECDTEWAQYHGAANTTEPKGLTPFGREVVAEMNRLGMIVDLAHASKQTMLDAINATAVPVIISHSSAAGVTDITRNVADEVLDKLKENKGIIMINFGAEFVRNISDPDARATMENVITHLDYIRDKTGSSLNVGIGADFDGAKEFAKDLEDVSKYPDLFDRLAETYDTHRGWTREELQNLAGNNLIRVMTAVQDYRDKLPTKTV